MADVEFNIHFKNTQTSDPQTVYQTFNRRKNAGLFGSGTPLSFIGSQSFSIEYANGLPEPYGIISNAPNLFGSIRPKCPETTNYMKKPYQVGKN